MRASDWDPIRATSGFTAAQTGRTHDRTRPMLQQVRKFLPRRRRPHMTHMYGPAVHRKRFSSIWRSRVLHQCIRPLIGAFCAPGHHGYQRACVLISVAKWVTRVSRRREDRSSISFHPLADLGGETGTMSLLSPDRCSSFVRAVRPFLRPGLQVVRGIARRGRQGWPSRLPLFPLQRLQATP